MTIQQTIEILAGLRGLDLPLPNKRTFGTDIDIHITPVNSESDDELDLLPEPMTEAESAAHTQYLLRELAKTEKKIADGTMRFLTLEEFFADDDEDEP
jgi:hypothetical protein